ncbi:hypothetical protein EAF04_007115 [Stromatinia cepivora]|nr:hypothetical protein EAF04_007115 [Stromatinia cepivora]
MVRVINNQTIECLHLLHDSLSRSKPSLFIQIANASTSREEESGVANPAPPLIEQDWTDLRCFLTVTPRFYTKCTRSITIRAHHGFPFRKVKFSYLDLIYFGNMTTTTLKSFPNLWIYSICYAPCFEHHTLEEINLNVDLRGKPDMYATDFHQNKAGDPVRDIFLLIKRAIKRSTKKQKGV